MSYSTLLIIILFPLMSHAKKESNMRVILDNRPKINAIFGGAPATAAAFPWQARLVFKKRNGYFLCTGSLLNEYFVLTAAHCTMGALALLVTLGNELSPRNPYYLHKGYQFAVTDWIDHPCYRKEQYQYDMSLIEAPEKIPFTSDIKPIRLPTDPTLMYENVAVTVVGWGETNGGPSDRLLYANLKTVDNVECARSHIKQYAAMELVSAYGLHMHTAHFLLCVRGKNVAVCIGDSGGPLIIKENGTETLIGITSFKVRSQCYQWNQPQSFVRVTKHLDWINAIIGRKAPPKINCIFLNTSQAVIKRDFQVMRQFILTLLIAFLSC